MGKVSDRPRRDRKADLRDGERQTRRGGAGVRQEDPADAAPRARPRAAAGAGGAVKEIRARSLHDKWLRTDPAYRREYQALEGEFALIEAMIQARADARLTSGTARAPHGDHSGGDRSAREWAHEAFDANAGAARQGDRNAAADFVRADRDGKGSRRCVLGFARLGVNGLGFCHEPRECDPST